MSSRAPLAFSFGERIRAFASLSLNAALLKILLLVKIRVFTRRGATIGLNKVHVSQLLLSGGPDFPFCLRISADLLAPSDVVLAEELRIFKDFTIVEAMFIPTHNTRDGFYLRRFLLYSVYTGAIHVV